MIETLKIILLCVAAAILYGIIHDQFTARICVEYFTIFHPPVFPTQSPTLLGIGWGIIATWWMGAFLAKSFAKWQLPDAFVFIEAIPRTSVGKFKKLALREQFADWKWE